MLVGSAAVPQSDGFETCGYGQFVSDQQPQSQDSVAPTSIALYLLPMSVGCSVLSSIDWAFPLVNSI